MQSFHEDSWQQESVSCWLLKVDMESVIIFLNINLTTPFLIIIMVFHVEYNDTK